jgi:hypothetical protein
MVQLNKDKKKSEEEFGGGSWPEAGFYHVAITQSEQTSSKRATPIIATEFQVLAEGLKPDRKTHTKGMTGRTARASLYLMSDKGEKETESCLEQVARFAMVAGLLPAGECVDTDDIQWEDAIGRECVIKVSEQMKEGKPTGYMQIDWMGFWSLGNSAMKDVPRDLKSPGMQAMAKGMVNRGTAPPVATDGNTAGSNGNAQPAAASASKSKYSDL